MIDISHFHAESLDVYDFCFDFHKMSPVIIQSIYISAKDKQFKLSATKLYKALTNSQLEIKRYYVNNQVKLYIKDPTTSIFVNAQNVLPALFVYLIQLGDQHPDQFKHRQIELVSNLNVVVSDVIDLLVNDSQHVDTLNPVDKSQYIVLQNGIFKRDELTQSYIEKHGLPKAIQLKNCDIVDPLPFNLLDEKSYQSDLSKINQHIYMTVLGDWFNSEDVLTAMQYQRAILEKDNREKALLLFSDGGEGKSSFVDMSLAMLGPNRATQIDLSNFDKDSSLCKIHDEIHLIYSTELNEGVIKTSAWTNFKKMTMNEKIDVFVKYGDNTEISTSAGLVFASNSQTRIPENNEASRRRLIALHLRPKSIQKRSSDFILKDKINDPKCVEIWANYILRNTENFTSYDISEMTALAIDNIVNESDMTYKFIQDQADMFNHIKIISKRLLYDMYVQWCIDTHRKDYTQTRDKFISKVSKHMKTLGYQDSTKKVKFNPSTSDESKMTSYLMQLSHKSYEKFTDVTFVRQEHFITKDDVTRVESLLSDESFDVNQLSSSDEIVLRHLAASGNTVAMQFV